MSGAAVVAGLELGAQMLPPVLTLVEQAVRAITGADERRAALEQVRDLAVRLGAVPTASAAAGDAFDRAIAERHAASGRAPELDPTAVTSGDPPWGLPRRVFIDRMSPAELAIRQAMAAVESAGASSKLTDAINLLIQAQEAVADHVDAHPATTPAQRLDPQAP